MKIAQITCVFPPYKGGIGQVAYHYGLELARLRQGCGGQGHDVCVFTHQQDEEHESFSEFKVERLKSWFKKGNAALMGGLLKRLKGFDVIHLHYPYFGAAGTVWLWKLFHKKQKLVITYHMDFAPKGFLMNILSLPDRLARNSLFKMADKIIVTSWDYAEVSDIKNLFIKGREKFVEIPLGVDLDRFRPLPRSGELLARHKLDSGNKIILFVGGLDEPHRFKGVDYLIQAFKLLSSAMPEARLIIAGQGKLEDEYRDTAAQLGVGGKVMFAGGVPDSELVEYYNLADAVVLPSTDKSEAFGLVLVEAMACGKPVIATNLPGVRSVVDNNMNGLLFENKNVEDLAQKMAMVLSESEMARRFGENGRRKAEERYDWGEIGRAVLRIYTCPPDRQGRRAN